LLGNGDGSFQAQQRFAAGYSPTSVALGDVNGDTVLDVVTVNMYGGEVSVLLGNGDGSFQAQQRFTVGDNPRSVALGDVNGDGVLDVVTSSIVFSIPSHDVSILLGNGDGSFQARQRFAIGNDLESLALGDVNGDAVLDVVTASGISGAVSVLLSNRD
jgi:hypothetical protein